MKELRLFIISFLIFTIMVFFIRYHIFGGSKNIENKYIEENYIEKSIYKSTELSEKKEIKTSDIDISLKSAYNINYLFFPNNYNLEIPEYVSTFSTFLNSRLVSNMIDNLTVELYKKKADVRGKMKNGRVKIFGTHTIELNEFNSVGIHEFAHYVDIYYLEKGVIKDISDYFYEISWDDTKVIKAGQKQEDFVSGYAMTNKYEDFAETFTYFVLHNEDFKNKSTKSNSLKKKYDFFSKYIFREGFLLNTDFSKNNEIKDYYRDITKIDFSLENFLEFLKK